MKALQGLLGDHQDSVMARRTLRELAAVAHAAGRATSPTGCCTPARRTRARAAEEALPEAWRSISREFPF
ncbi:CYTH and CHAD domain-containing protein OS=Streptomyces tendae OX=1932 GN=GUR47_05725 PE=4 SV=1 [Streptomyces tendae]